MKSHQVAALRTELTFSGFCFSFLPPNRFKTTNTQRKTTTKGKWRIIKDLVSDHMIVAAPAGMVFVSVKIANFDIIHYSKRMK
jgi:hypothetical protein